MNLTVNKRLSKFVEIDGREILEQLQKEIFKQFSHEIGAESYEDITPCGSMAMFFNCKHVIRFYGKSNEEKIRDGELMDL